MKCKECGTVMERKEPFVMLLEDERDDVDEYEMTVEYVCDHCGTVTDVKINIETNSVNAKWSKPVLIHTIIN